MKTCDSYSRTLRREPCGLPGCTTSECRRATVDGDGVICDRCRYWTARPVLRGREWLCRACLGENTMHSGGAA